MLHLAARLQGLAAGAPRLCSLAEGSGPLLPLPALCHMLSTCSSAQLQLLAGARASQLSSLAPLAARWGTPLCAEPCGAGRHAAGLRRGVHASAASHAAPAAGAEQGAARAASGCAGGEQGGSGAAAAEQRRLQQSLASAQLCRGLHASAASSAATAAQREQEGAREGSSATAMEHSDDESVEEQRRRLQRGVVAALQQRLSVGDEAVDWGDERVILHSTYHDYQFSAKAFYVGALSVALHISAKRAGVGVGGTPVTIRSQQRNAKAYFRA